MNESEREAYLLDIVRAVNEVTDKHGVGPTNRRACMAVLGERAEAGEWFSVKEDDSE